MLPFACVAPTEDQTMVSFLSDFWSFMSERKKFWMLPIMIVLIAIGGLLILAKGSAVAPFIYTLF
jgi:hypothetical protein